MKLQSLIISLALLAPTIAVADNDSGGGGGNHGIRGLFQYIVEYVQQKVTEIESSISQIGTELETVKAEINGQISSLRTDVDSNTSRIAANESAIATLPAVTTYNHLDFLGPNVNEKVWSRMTLEAPNSCDRITTTVSRTDEGAGVTRIDHSNTWSRSIDGTTCFSDNVELRNSADRFTWDGYRTNSYTWTMNSPVVLLTSDMIKGGSIAGGGTYTHTDFNGSATHVMIQNNSVIGLEDVTVPAGSFSGCLRVHASRAYGGTSGTTEINLFRWYCPGVGNVKEIRAYSSGREEVRELISYL